MKQRYRRLVEGHRGARGLVKFENTIESFEKAIECDADAVECDIRKTKDNIIIINHNPDILGLLIKDHTYEELEKVCQIEGYHLPTLKETLDYVKGKIGIDIELKETGYEEEIVNQVLSVLSVDEFHTRSFFDSAILKIKELNNEITTILLLGTGDPKPFIRTRLSEFFPKKRIIKSKCDMVSPYIKFCTKNYVKKIHKLDKKVIVWTVNSEEDMIKYLYNIRCDGVVTDFPNKAISLVSTRSKKYDG